MQKLNRSSLPPLGLIFAPTNIDPLNAIQDRLSLNRLVQKGRRDKILGLGNSSRTDRPTDAISITVLRLEI